MTSKLHSTAVKARRLTADSLQLFPTPPWATRAPIEQELLPRGWITAGMTAWDPCCGKGHMAVPLGEYFDGVFASDVHDWGYGDRHGLDFTFAAAEDAPWPVDWIFINPPFTLAEAFLERALRIARVGVALFVRLQWQEGGERYWSIWNGDRRPHLVCPFAERVAIIEGVWDPEASSATAYMWVVFVHGEDRPDWPLCHIRPGAEARYTRISDMMLATPGEAARRKQRKRAGA
ncbi:MAG: SAM-dependent DNA methyltransferase [Aquamicrobium sp.]|nr:SAM-dependent DNA methyltransferase [Aquamicrobium sp.]